jgi:ABC-type multidrug transport system fused ATPase/permease subunit
VIFSGTVRSNLDPFDQAGGDAAIWQALRQAGIDGLVKSLGVRYVYSFCVFCELACTLYWQNFC